jgi:signal transduction histidine kinase/ActR/RegA family two-component response regulator
MRELEYLRRCCETDAGKILSLDAQCIALRTELEQKRRGFSLMADLTATLRRDADYGGIFITVARRLNAALNMQRTAVLFPAGNDDTFAPRVLQGYPVEEERAVMSKTIRAGRDLLDMERPVLVNGSDTDERLAGLRSALGLRYLISCPIVLNNRIEGLLVTGRMVEAPPFLSRLTLGDVETVQTVGSHLAALMALDSVREADKRAKIMLDATPIGCILFDENFNRIDCNEAVVRLYGASSKKRYMERMDDTFPKFQPNGRSSYDLSREIMKNAFSDGYARFEWMTRSFSGEPIPIEFTLVRVEHENGFIVAGYIMDMREQKAMLGSMRRKEDELRAARDLAEKNARAKSEFIANMSHEINTPLNAIMGMGRLLEGTELNDAQREYLNNAMHSVKLLHNIIDDILDISAIDSGRLKMEQNEFSVRDIVQNVCGMVKEESAAKSLELNAEVDISVPCLLVGDSLRVEQALFNLVKNAVKFTPSGSVSIKVSCVERVKARAKLLFEVRDTGIGMTKEQADKIFSPFYQADSSHTRKYGGTGIGLALCKGLVDLMKGDIWFKTEQGHGSEFSFRAEFRLPDIPSAEDKPRNDGNEDDLGALEGMKVLLVEDNEINQMVAAEFLAAKGIETEIVETGLEAVNALNSGTPCDIVLMDIQMPEMDGITATRRLRENPMFKKLPIIALTAHSLPEDRELSLASGMNDHLTKPIDPALLYSALRQWDPRPRDV